MAVGVKRKRTGETVDATILRPQKIAKPVPNDVALQESTSVPEDMEPQLQRITESDRTPFEKKVVSLWDILGQYLLFPSFCPSRAISYRLVKRAET